MRHVMSLDEKLQFRAPGKANTRPVDVTGGTLVTTLAVGTWPDT